MSLPYVINTGSILTILKHIQEAGQPEKVTMAYVKSVGFTSSNDQKLPGFLKRLGFVDESGAPTDTWGRYRDTSLGPKVLATAIRRTYAGLFELYPDAHRKDAEAIQNWMKVEEPKASPRTVSRALDSFKALIPLADFEAERPSEPPPAKRPPAETDAGVQQSNTPLPVSHNPPAAGLTVNIELHLPATNDGAVYEKLFAAMQKYHLISNAPRS